MHVEDTRYTNVSIYEVDLLATLPMCPVDAMVAYWTCLSTEIPIAAEFSIRSLSVALFPSSGTPGVASQLQHLHGVGKAGYKSQSDL